MWRALGACSTCCLQQGASEGTLDQSTPFQARQVVIWVEPHDNVAIRDNEQVSSAITSDFQSDYNLQRRSCVVFCGSITRNALLFTNT